MPIPQHQLTADQHRSVARLMAARMFSGDPILKFSVEHGRAVVGDRLIPLPEGAVTDDDGYALGCQSGIVVVSANGTADVVEIAE